jgi:adenosylcobinamide-GDP ribazoletransferase
VRDALRLTFGTLTVLPVRPPGHVDRRTAGAAMVLAPLVGLVLAGFAAAALRLLDGTSPLLAASLTVALLAALTRGMHLDGLADTADGLGSGKPPAEALALMRRGDVGPFGVVTLVLALLVQVAALADLVARGLGALGVGVALVVSRFVLPLVCTSRVPAARADGLGSAVAGSVRGRGLGVSALLAVVGVAAVVGVVGVVGFVGGTGWSVVHLAGTLLIPVVVAAVWCRHCVRRLGGVTGDVLGACVEVAFTTALVVAGL